MKKKGRRKRVPKNQASFVYRRELKKLMKMKKLTRNRRIQALLYSLCLQGRNQTAVAKLLQTTKSNISNWMHGKITINTESIRTITEIVKLNAEYFLTMRNGGPTPKYFFEYLQTEFPDVYNDEQIVLDFGDSEPSDSTPEEKVTKLRSSENVSVEPPFDFEQVQSLQKISFLFKEIEILSYKAGVPSVIPNVRDLDDYVESVYDKVCARKKKDGQEIKEN